LIHEVRPSVIHARNWGAWPDVAVARLLTRPIVPLIFSFHGLSEPGPMPLRRRVAFRLLAQITTRVFTVCEAAKQFLVARTGLPPQRIQVIPNGIDTTQFAPAARVPVGGRLVIGTVGSLTPMKNQAILLRAVSRLVAGQANVEVRVAGDGPRRGSLATLAAELGLANRVQFLGHVADIAAFLRSLDVFALPSDSEAHPNALLEAMACGLPCVATRVGGVPEILNGGAAGLLVDAGDERALATALAGLLADPGRRTALGQAAHAHVCRWYSLDRMIDAYALLYNELNLRRP
jgi:glycosyltransferase involved in cell wall biosynthesis